MSKRASARRGTRRSGTTKSKSAPRIARRRGKAVAMSHASGGIGSFSKRGGGGYRGFKSKAQWRWAWATHKSWARKKAHETAGGPKARYRRLPERKGGPSARTAR